MAAYVPVPRDLSKVKTKVFFNLTKRQLICFGGAALIGIPVFFGLKKVTGNTSLAVMGMMIIMLPLFFLAMYERDGQPLEVIAKHFVESKFIRPKVRPYQTDNYYSILMRQAQAEREVKQIVRKKQAQNTKQKKHGRHVGKGKTLAKSLKARTDYAQNPEKTEKGNLVTSYECDPMTCDEEFLLSKRQYQQYTGREQQRDVVAYQIRQSFKPGEVTAEEANRIGYELAMAFTKGNHAFIVATHTDRPHIHNHIIFNSTSLDCRRKFRDYLRSGKVLQHVSDRICLEHGLSVIEPKPHTERTRRVDYPKKATFRDQICAEIDQILAEQPKDFEEFLRRLETSGYEIKKGTNPALKGKGQIRFIRLRSLGEGYTEEDLRKRLAGKKLHRNRVGSPHQEASRFHLLIDIQEKMKQGKGAGYERWAKVFNLKQMSETFLFMRDHHIESFEELYEKTDAAVSHFHELSNGIKTAETRMAANLVLQKHIQNYAKTKGVYDAYRKSGYSRNYFEEHRAELTLHKTAKEAFRSYGSGKLPAIRELRQEYAELITKKKGMYQEYRKAKKEMQDYLTTRQNVEQFYGEDLKKEREAAKRQKKEL